MKRKYIYFSLVLVLCTVLTVFIYSITKRSQTKTTPDENVYSELLTRKSSLLYPAEWTAVKRNADILSGRVKKNQADTKALVALTALYLQEARVTGNFGYYNSAAMKCIHRILAGDANNFEALTFKTTILLSQHQFEDGHLVAQQLQQLYPLNAYVYGLLVDADVELGKYAEAVDAADKMVSIRPDIRSYSRIAYLREIHGDIPGAIEAMKMAIDAGAPGDENTEWCRIQTGRLFEKLGKVNDAKMHYTIALENRPDYPYAIAGLARVAIAGKNYTDALKLFQHADSVIPDHTFKEGMAEIYLITGQPENAKRIALQNLEYMKQFSSGAKKDLTDARHEETGQNEDHEMAHAYMGVGDYDNALTYALKEYRRRVSNIEVNETVAIVYYAKGDYSNALSFIDTALKTNCRNPELLCHAGLIYAKAGKIKQAKIFLSDALQNNPCIPQELEQESRAMLKKLL
jgi:tetratricopeptide (TPR) repeat protein